MKTEVTANEESVAITISDERLAALEMYLEQKNIKLSDEIDKCIDGLYQKNVPQNVRDFIDMMSAKKPARCLRIGSGTHVKRAFDTLSGLRTRQLRTALRRGLLESEI